METSPQLGAPRVGALRRWVHHSRFAPPAVLAAAATAGWWLRPQLAPGPLSFGPFRCPVRALTGFDCPGCGSTRCLSALARGDLLTAVDHNLLVVVVVVAAVVAAGLWVARQSLRLPVPALPTLRPTAALWGLGTFTLLRAVPLAGLSWLASPA